MIPKGVYRIVKLNPKVVFYPTIYLWINKNILITVNRRYHGILYKLFFLLFILSAYALFCRLYRMNANPIVQKYQPGPHK